MIVVFLLLAAVSVVTGALVFVVDSMARATYALALSFVAVAVALLTFGLTYLGVITILMMVMEMAIMAVYMIMFMGMNPALMPMDMVHGKRPALAVSVGIFALLVVGIVVAPWSGAAGSASAPTSDIAALGHTLMGSKMLVMMSVSPIMFATIVGGVVLASGRTRYDRFGDDLDHPAQDPTPGGVGR
ncbi:MAG: NADH-quinone oxidoreductase subunit J [Actinomycetota bacterium]|nr:NADH-quinone oxidoreductase subunit J [Actinomycetota bacterium]